MSSKPSRTSSISKGDLFFWTLVLATMTLPIVGCGSSPGASNSGGSASASQTGGGSGGGGGGGAVAFNQYSVTFDGSTQYLGSSTAAISNYPFAMSAWVKTTATTSGAIMGLYDTGAWNRYFRVTMKGNGTLTMTARNTTARNATTSVTINDGNWHQVVAVFSSATSRTLYVDGVSAATSGSSVNFSSLASQFAVGVSQTSTPGTFFNGEMDEVALFNQNYLAADVTTLYNSGTSQDLVGATGIAGWWRMGDALGDDLGTAGIITDQIGSQHFAATGFSGVSPTADAP